MKIYSVFGLVIESPLHLPAPQSNSTNIDVTISYGKTPNSLGHPVVSKLCSQTSPGEYLLNIENVARYYVKNGKMIVIERAAYSEDREILLFLISNVMCALLIQRKIYPLLGCSLLINNSGVLFCGSRGCGTSSVTAALLSQGYKLISDDMAVIRNTDDSQSLLYPGFNIMQLWSDTTIGLKLDKTKLTQTRPLSDLYFFKIENGFCINPVVLKKIVLFSRNYQKVTLSISSLEGMNKIRHISEMTNKKHIIKGNNLEGDHFRQFANICDTIDISLLTIPGSTTTINQLTTSIQNFLDR